MVFKIILIFFNCFRQRTKQNNFKQTKTSKVLYKHECVATLKGTNIKQNLQTCTKYITSAKNNLVPPFNYYF